jgi:hypothetical protein
MVSALRGTLEGIEAENGVQAGELSQLLEDLDVDSERRVPTARILALFRGSVRL